MDAMSDQVSAQVINQGVLEEEEVEEGINTFP